MSRTRIPSPRRWAGRSPPCAGRRRCPTTCWPEPTVPGGTPTTARASSPPRRAHPALLLDPALQGGVGGPAGRARDGDQRPWLESTPWPNTWWNLNVQLEYWLIHGSNHLELDAVTRALSEFRGNLSKEVSDRYRADSLGIPRTTDPQLVNGAAGTSPATALASPARTRPLPRSATSPGPCTTCGSATATPWTSRSCGTSSSPAAQGGQLLPALPGAGHGQEVAPARHLLPEYGGNSRDCNYDLMLLTWGAEPCWSRPNSSASTTSWHHAGARCWPSGWRTRPTPTAS